MTAGDERFVAIYEAHYGAVYAYCRRRTTADRVDDAVANVFLTAWRKISSLPSEDEILPWLYKVAFRALGHQWRGSNRASSLKSKLSSIGVDQVPEPDEVVIVREDARTVVDALSRLKPIDQEILRLALWEDLPRRDIAFALGLSPDAVKKRLSRARQNLTREYNRLETKRRHVPAAQEGGAW